MTMVFKFLESCVGNMSNKKDKKTNHGFNDSNFEKEIMRIRKIGKKIKKENIKVPDIPNFFKKIRKKWLKTGGNNRHNFIHIIL